MALKKDPSRRYASAEQFADDIARYLNDEPVRASADGWVYRTRKFLSRNRWTTAFAGIAAFSLVIGAITASQQARVAREAQLRAQSNFALARKFSNETLTTVMTELRAVEGTQPLRRALMKKTVAQLEILATQAKTDPTMLREIGRAYRTLADAQGDFGDIPISEVIANYERALRLYERVYEGDESCGDCATELMASQIALASTLTMTSPEDARGNALLTAAIGVGEKASIRHPNDVRLAIQYALAMSEYGALDARICGSYCLSYQLQAMSKFETMLKRVEGEEWESVMLRLGQTYLALASAVDERNANVPGETNESLLTKAVSTFDSLVDRAVEKPNYAATQALAYAARSLHRVDRGDVSAGLTDARRANSISVRLAAANPNEAMMQVIRVVASTALSDALAENKVVEEAISQVAITKHLINALPNEMRSTETVVTMSALTGIAHATALAARLQTGKLSRLQREKARESALKQLEETGAVLTAAGFDKSVSGAHTLKRIQSRAAKVRDALNAS